MSNKDKNMQYKFMGNFKPVHEKGKTIPVTCRGGLFGCNMSRIPHFVDSHLRDGGEVVSFTHQPCFTAQKDFTVLISVSS
jgi:hypothetical protein